MSDEVPQRLAGPVAIVTGARRGIGLAIARRLVAEGARVAPTARGADALADAVGSLGGADVAIGVAGKADNVAHQDGVIARVREAFGPVDILVNNTGINPAFGKLTELELGAARTILEVKVLSTLRWVQKVCAAGMAERGGAIVNISSISSIRPSPGISFYGVSKAAVNHLTVGLAAELGPTIPVNAVAPAVVKNRFAAELYEGRETQVAPQYPLGRLSEPDDVAATVAVLGSSDASFITRQTLVVDWGAAVAGRRA
jgi:NAD(P)-dependent dehydrogenase (short-subunit alcohol dehydrogenase family)